MTTTKPESHIPDHVKDIEAMEMEPEFADEAALALKRIATSDMAPITDVENAKLLKKIDLWLMPTVCIPSPSHPSPTISLLCIAILLQYHGIQS